MFVFRDASLVSAILSYTCLTVLVLESPVTKASVQFPRSDPASIACQLLQESLPQLVSFPGSGQYDNDIAHWAETSMQNSTCSVEPETAADVGTILQIVGRQDIRAPFAVKSGGHAVNLGASSTTGVQISMARFTGFSFDAENSTVTLGVGQVWDQAYSQLEPLGMMIVGGRTNGVGIGGFSLGGGYSWKTDQYGLTIDTIVALNLVLPSGEQLYVTNTSNPDLFFALKGGLNNFGIVTDITLEAHPQTQVYGGLITYPSNVIDSVNSAVSNFSLANTDPKAQLFAMYTALGSELSTNVNLFYDAPTPPDGVFDSFMAITALTSDVKTRSFVDFLNSISGIDTGIGAFGAAVTVIPITNYTVPLLDEMVTLSIDLGEELITQNNGAIIEVGVTAEPFTNPFSHSLGGAYPHPPTRQVTPTSAQIVYPINSNLSADAQTALQASLVSSLKTFAQDIQAKAVSEGVSQLDDILYPNYAIAGTPIELMYGSNVGRLAEIAAEYDPSGVMNLTGGFHF